MSSNPKKEGGLGLDNLVSKNITLVAKWLWRFPLECHFYCIRLTEYVLLGQE